MNLIISLLDTPAFGGAEQYLLTHLYALQKLPNTTVVLATNRQAVKDRVIEDGNKISVIHLPYRLDAIGNWKGLVKYLIQAPLALIWFLITTRKLSKSYHHITVYTPGFSDRMLFSPFIKWFGHRLAWLEFGPLKPLFKRNWGFPKLLYALGKPFPDAVITISEYTKQCMLRDTTLPAKKIIIVYPTTPPVTPSQLTHLKKMGQEWQRKKNLQKKKIITFVGRLASEKEVDLLVKAFALVHDKQPDTHLLIIGDGPEREQYAKLVEKLNIKSAATFTGFISESEKRSLLAASTLFVFPSAWELEGFGMTTLEAMMLEVPVVSSGSGPQAEIVKDEQSGLIFTPHTSTALAKKITLVLSKPLAAKNRALKAKHMIQKSFQDRQLQTLIETLKV